MVYSTCSMSPYEDEAVVAELLRQFQGQLELVDAREFVPVFKARKGLSDWHVLDDRLAIKKEIDEQREINKRAKVERKAAAVALAASTATATTTTTVGDNNVGEEVNGEENGDENSTKQSSKKSKNNEGIAMKTEGSGTVECAVIDAVQAGIVTEESYKNDDERENYISPISEDPFVGE